MPCRSSGTTFQFPELRGYHGLTPQIDEVCDDRLAHSVYRQVDHGGSPATFESDTGARLAVWQTSFGGLDWIRDLVKQGKAIDLGGNGYPSRYTALASSILPQIAEGPPDANTKWVCGPSDVVTDKWEGRTVVDAPSVDACGADEWLLIEAWDES